jgi:hypothetical protein
MRGTKSLEVIAAEVRYGRQIQLSHYDAIDAKAGITLGFAGALVVLARTPGFHAAVGRSAAVLSGLLSVASFWPRRFWHTDLRELRDSYLAAEPEFTRLRLLDTQILSAERIQRTLVQKATLLKAAMIALAMSVLLSAGGLTVHSR